MSCEIKMRTPVCPDDGTPFTYLGISGGKNRSRRFKIVCHKSFPLEPQEFASAKRPVPIRFMADAFKLIPIKAFVFIPVSHVDLMKGQRVVIERSISSFKSSFCLDGRLTSNPKTTNADLLLVGIVQLIGVLLARAIHQLNMALRLRKLVA